MGHPGMHNVTNMVAMNGIPSRLGPRAKARR